MSSPDHRVSWAINERLTQEYSRALEDVREKLVSPLLIAVSRDDSNGARTIESVGDETVLSEEELRIIDSHFYEMSEVSSVLEISDDIAVYSGVLHCFRARVTVRIIAVNPEVLPEDLIRNDEIGGILPWAALSVKPSIHATDLIAESISGMAPRAFLMGICANTFADSAIIWMLDPTARRSRMCAKASWGTKDELTDFEIPRGRGVVGLLTAKSKPEVYDLASSRPYNPSIVQSEQWRECIALPVIAGGDIIGAVSLYKCSKFDSNAIKNINKSDISQKSIQFVRRFRKLAIQEEREKLIESRMERLQVGVELLGFAHDLAENAQRTTDRAQELAATLRPQSLTPEASQLLTDLRDDARLVHRFTRAMNRLAGGRSKENTDFDLQKEVMKIEPILSAMSSNVEINIPLGLLVNGDPLDVQRIVINLVSNARHWTADSGGRINVYAKSVVIDSEPYVDLYVEDNGSGMTAAVKRNAATLLYTTRRNGLGLGLFVVKKLSDRLEGAFNIVKSEPHMGTTIRVRIPSIGHRE